jgi:TRAP transporter TAXI family solute receptor
MRGRRLLFEHPALWLYALAAALLASAAAASLMWLVSLPPRVVVMSTGAPGSDYDQFAPRYQAILKRSGVTLRLLSSAGAVENLQRLNDPKSGVSVGFAQGGLTTDAQSPELRSLGTMFFEPFWFFTRFPPGPRLEALRGKVLSIGQPGGGTRALAARLLALNGIDQSIAELRSLTPTRASDALLHGEIDAMTLVASWDSPVVRQLLASSDVNLVGFPRADAYVALYPELSKLILPAGVGNMATNRPPTDVNLIASKASLIVRRDLHPAIQYLLLEAATEIQSAPTIFHQAGQFPAAERGDVPLSGTARQFYKSGTPFLQRYLPFWLAVLASQLLLLLIPVMGIAYPLVRLAPMLYRWSVQRRIFRLYGELQFIEAELARPGGAVDGDAIGRLNRLDERANRMLVPVAYANLLYTLRSHIALARDQAARNPTAVS